jgi:hypothetical protein
VYAAGTIVRRIVGVTSDQDPWLFRTAAGGTSGLTEPNWNLTIGASNPADNTVTDWKTLQDETNGLSLLSNPTAISIGGNVASGNPAPYQWTKVSFYSATKPTAIGPTNLLILGDSIMSETGASAWLAGHYLRRPQEIAAQTDPCVPAIVTLAHPGDGFADILNNLKASRYYRNAERVSGAIVQGGVNDMIASTTAAVSAGNAQLVINALRTITSNIVLGQVLPAAGALTGPQQTQRTALNLDLAGGGANPVT